MSVRQTSIDAYNTIKDNGLLSKRRWEAYDLLFRHGPCTAKEMMHFAISEGIKNHIYLYSLEKRLSELVDSGCVSNDTEKTCSQTGMTALVWETTDLLPKKIDSDTKTPTRVELIDSLCKLLESALPHSKNAAWQSRAKTLLTASSKYRKKNDRHRPKQP